MQMSWMTFSISEINCFQVTCNGSNENPLVSVYLSTANWFLIVLLKLNSIQVWNNHAMKKNCICTKCKNASRIYV